jgi:hypothetical protein
MWRYHCNTSFFSRGGAEIECLIGELVTTHQGGIIYTVVAGRDNEE